jgi:acyl carrier protein
MELGIDQFIKLVEDEFDDLEPGIMKPNSKFKEVMEWNSINALIFVALVKTEFDVDMNADDLIKSETVQDLYDLIAAKADQ